MQIGNRVSEVENEFRRTLSSMQGPVVLELGTRRYEPSFPTHHAVWLPRGASHVKADMEHGEDVDLVTDAHNLRVDDDSVDAVIAVAIFEHLRRPWIAAKEIHRVLKPGGIVYTETHHTFPEHGYPDDYWRFSRGALFTIFDDAGMDVRSTAYHYPVKIIVPSDIERWNAAAPAWLNVDLFAVKP